jgi:1-acyl-sn-glycerol-3-phosphate acyltransferase
MGEALPPVPKTCLRYRLIKLGISGVMNLYGGYDVRGREHLPLDRGAMICPNHISYLDPPAIGAIVPRHTYFMAKKELFTVPFLGTLIRTSYAFPVDREGSDRAAVRTALEVLQAGNLLTIFIEGARSPDGSLQPASTGPALIANRAGVTIIPASLRFTDKMLPRGSRQLHRARVQVDFGAPVDPADFGAGRLDKDALRALTETVMQRIEALQKAQYERTGEVAPPRTKELPDASQVPSLRR